MDTVSRGYRCGARSHFFHFFVNLQKCGKAPSTKVKFNPQSMPKRHLHRGGKGHKRRRANDSSSSSDDERPSTGPAGKKKIQAAVSKGSEQIKRENDFSRLPPVPDFSGYLGFRRDFWTGPPAEDPPSEALKLSRKERGILAKGVLRLCPPPVPNASARGLPDSFQAVFTQLRLSVPTPVQMQCWPAILAGANVLGIATTGSGKTLAYGMPMIPHITERLKAIGKLPHMTPIALVLVPTRELAVQVASSFKCFAKVANIRSAAVHGGRDREAELNALQADGPIHILAATPGRLLDLMGSRQMKLDRVSYVVVDEADRMLQLGFEEQLNLITERIRPDRQAHLFRSVSMPCDLLLMCAHGGCCQRDFSWKFTRGLEAVDRRRGGVHSSGGPDPAQPALFWRPRAATASGGCIAYYGRCVWTSSRGRDGDGG